jgi:hypothetical protein
LPAALSDCWHFERMPQLPVPNSNAHSLPARAHAASFNAASNRSRAERGETFVTRDLFEASGIPMKPAMHSNLKPATCSDPMPAAVPI